MAQGCALKLYVLRLKLRLPINGLQHVYFLLPLEFLVMALDLAWKQNTNIIYLPKMLQYLLFVFIIQNEHDILLVFWNIHQFSNKYFVCFSTGLPMHKSIPPKSSLCLKHIFIIGTQLNYKHIANLYSPNDRNVLLFGNII